MDEHMACSIEATPQGRTTCGLWRPLIIPCAPCSPLQTLPPPGGHAPSRPQVQLKRKNHVDPQAARRKANDRCKQVLG